MKEICENCIYDKNIGRQNMTSNNKNDLGMYYVSPFRLNSIYNVFDLPVYTIIPFNID